MKTTILNNIELGFVEVPEDSTPYLSYKNKSLICYKYYNPDLRKFTTRKVKLPPGNWQIVGMSDNLTEDEAEKITPSGYFTDYDEENFPEQRLMTAREVLFTELYKLNITSPVLVIKRMV